MFPLLRLDIVHTSPVVTTALRDELGRGHPAVTVASSVHSWADFQVEWDFAGDIVVIDALLDDHVPLALKVRALRRLGSRAIVLGPGRDTPFARRASAEGAWAWIEPTRGLAETADLVGGSHSADPTPRAGHDRGAARRPTHRP